jgi:hypothetical protein
MNKLIIYPSMLLSSHAQLVSPLPAVPFSIQALTLALVLSFLAITFFIFTHLLVVRILPIRLSFEPVGKFCPPIHDNLHPARLLCVLYQGYNLAVKRYHSNHRCPIIKSKIVDTIIILLRKRRAVLCSRPWRQLPI